MRKKEKVGERIGGFENKCREEPECNIEKWMPTLGHLQTVEIYNRSYPTRMKKSPSRHMNSLRCVVRTFHPKVHLLSSKGGKGEVYGDMAGAADGKNRKTLRAGTQKLADINQPHAVR